MFDDGDVVETGRSVIEWSIRAFIVDDEQKFDWIMDDARGGYMESDEYFDSIEEARQALSRY